MKKGIEAVTDENFEECAQEIWRVSCRRTKVLAGRVAGWMASTIVLLLIWAGVGFFGDPDPINSPALHTCSVLWRDICATVWPGIKAINDDTFEWFSLFIAIPIAVVVDQVTAAVVRLIWVQPKRKMDPIPAGDSALARAEELHRRAKAVKQPGFEQVLNRIVVVFFSVVILFLCLAESGEFDLIEGFLFYCFAVCVITLVLMLPRFACNKLNSFLYLKRETHLVSVTEKYLRQCKEKADRDAWAEKAKQERLHGDELYRQAIAKQPVDEEMISEAADLGCRPACLYMGRRLLDAYSNGAYTIEEKKELAEAGKEYFRVASQEEHFPASKAEAEFGYLTFVTLTERGNSTKWQKILEQLRSIRSSGLLPEHLDEPCERLIRTVVELVDEAKSSEKYQFGSYSSSSTSTMSKSDWDKLNDELDCLKILNDHMGGLGWSDDM